VLANRKHAVDGQRALVQAQGLPNARAEPDAMTPCEGHADVLVAELVHVQRDDLYLLRRTCLC
jgi:hypothetical protein